jgi:hypothetical protein
MYDHESSEIDTSQKILLLDDLLHFSISARRLIELTALKSFSNNIPIVLQYFDDREVPVVIHPTRKHIGFLTLINTIIHAKFVELFRTRFDYAKYIPGKIPSNDDEIFRYIMLLKKIEDENRWNEYAVAPTVLIISDNGRASIIVLKDLVKASAAVAEKIIEVCSASNISLEVDSQRAG